MNWLQKTAQQVFYHGTTGNRSKQILSSGLMANSSAVFDESISGNVYLTTNAEGAFNWVIESFVSGSNQFSGNLSVVIFRVDGNCIDPSLLSDDWVGQSNYLYAGNILPECLMIHYERDVSNEMSKYLYGLQQSNTPDTYLSPPPSYGDY